MRALVELAHRRRPELLVYSGDMTQRAQRDEFDAARTFCRELGIARTLTLPGNHDIPLFDVFQRAFRPYARYLAAFGPRLEPCLDMDGFLVLGVNTTRPARHKNGEVSPAQVERVARQLHGTRAGQLRIVVTHQPARDQACRAASAPTRRSCSSSSRSTAAGGCVTTMRSWPARVP